MRPLAEGAASILELLRRSPEDADGLVIHITHDSVMAPFLAHVLQRRALDEVLPGYLEAVAIDLGSTPPHVVWRRGRHSLGDRSDPSARRRASPRS